MQVLDIACGVGELLLRMAARHGIHGVGVDVSEGALARARAVHEETLPGATLEFLQLDGKDYVPPAGREHDIVSLVGASWVFDGYAETLAALHSLVRPGGLVLFGEPFWKVSEPPSAYLEAEELTRDMFTDLGGLLAACEAAGFRVTYQVTSSGQDWDRYEMLQALSVDRWAQEHPDHPDRDEVLAVTRRAQHSFLTWGRDALGFTQMILRRIN
jgi:cyclopropane fatty-acyl-phospholipid synthase-like methyltransferase